MFAFSCVADSISVLITLKSCVFSNTPMSVFGILVRFQDKWSKYPYQLELVLNLVLETNDGQLMTSEMRIQDKKICEKDF